MSLDYILTQTYRECKHKICNYYVFIDYRKDKYINISFKQFKKNIDGMTTNKFISYKRNDRLKINYPSINENQLCVFCENIYQVRRFLKKFTSTFLDYNYSIKTVNELWKQ